MEGLGYPEPPTLWSALSGPEHLLKGVQRGKHIVSQPGRSLGFGVPASKPLHTLGCQPCDRSVQVWMP